MFVKSCSVAAEVAPAESLGYSPSEAFSPPVGRKFGSLLEEIWWDDAQKQPFQFQSLCWETSNAVRLKAAFRIQRFERADAATKIDSFGSDRKRPRWELNLFLKNRSLAIRLIAKFYQLRMRLFGRSARALKTLAMESSLKEKCFNRSQQEQENSCNIFLLLNVESTVPGYILLFEISIEIFFLALTPALYNSLRCLNRPLFQHKRF